MCDEQGSLLALPHLIKLRTNSIFHLLHYRALHSIFLWWCVKGWQKNKFIMFRWGVIKNYGAVNLKQEPNELPLDQVHKLTGESV